MSSSLFLQSGQKCYHEESVPNHGPEIGENPTLTVSLNLSTEYDNKVAAVLDDKVNQKDSEPGKEPKFQLQLG